MKGDSVPIYARITVDGKRAEISLKRQIKVTYWDTKSKRTSSRLPEGKALNQYLDQVYAKLLECHKQLSSGFDHVSAKGIKARFLGQDERHKSLLELITYHNKNMTGTLKPGTLKNYFTTENYIKRFLIKKKKVNDIYLKQLSYSFIIEFEQFLRKGQSINKSQPLKNNGIMKHLERLKKLMNLATELEWIDKNPFFRFKLKFNKHEKEFLSKRELELLERTNIQDKGHQIVRDIFVFSCYTGLSYIDVKMLRESNIVKGIDGNYWLYTQREKNGQSVKIPLLDNAWNILKKYSPHPEKSNGLLLPVYSNQKINAYLKGIAGAVGISKKLTFHSARHTFATTVTLSNGVPIETVSKLLGHCRLSTTQVYARVIEEKLSVDMKLLRQKLNESTKKGIGQKIRSL
ncbi:site-specific integrase [Jejuia pallidilutea]|nr:site-specific integrase [Jejuia pallidilutea]